MATVTTGSGIEVPRRPTWQSVASSELTAPPGSLPPEPPRLEDPMPAMRAASSP